MSIQNNIESLQSILTAVNELPDGSSSSGSGTLQTKTVTPTANAQTIKPDSGYSGLSQVTINGDSDLIASNIRSGKNIFGVTGTLEGKVYVEKEGSITGNNYNNNSGYTYINCGFKPDYVFIWNNEGYWSEFHQKIFWYSAEANFNAWAEGVSIYGPVMWTDVGDFTLLNFYDFYRDNNGFGFQLYGTYGDWSETAISPGDVSGLNLTYWAVKYQ